MIYRFEYSETIEDWVNEDIYNMFVEDIETEQYKTENYINKFYEVITVRRDNTIKDISLVYKTNDIFTYIDLSIYGGGRIKTKVNNNKAVIYLEVNKDIINYLIGKVK